VADEIQSPMLSLMGTRGLSLEPGEESTASRCLIQLAPCPVLVVP